MDNKNRHKTGTDINPPTKRKTEKTIRKRLLTLLVLSGGLQFEEDFDIIVELEGLVA
jgi:hypothetical protein